MRGLLSALVFAVALAGCDTGTSDSLSIQLDSLAVPDTLTAGVPFRVSVSGESTPPVDGVRLFVFRGEPEFRAGEPANDRLVEVRLDVDAPVSTVSLDTMVTIPSGAVSQTERITLYVMAYDESDGMERSRGGSGTSRVVRPAR